MLIQNDKSLVIFQYLQAKLQRFRNYKVLLRTARANHKFLFVFQVENSLHFRFWNFTMLQKKQKIFALADRAFALNSETALQTCCLLKFTSIVSEFKDKLRTNETKNSQKIKKSQPPKINWFL